MKIIKKTFNIIGIILLLLVVIFLAGRFGWKALGFRACQGAGIETVAVSEDAVRIIGYYPGSFPEGFCGYYAREYDGKLYVGFRFSAVFGAFETGDFDVTIPVRGKIDEVVLKTEAEETRIWTAASDFLPQSEQYGVYVRPEREDVAAAALSYGGFDGAGTYTLEGDILYASMTNDLDGTDMTMELKAEKDGDQILLTMDRKGMTLRWAWGDRETGRGEE